MYKNVCMHATPVWCDGIDRKSIVTTSGIITVPWRSVNIQQEVVL